MKKLFSILILNLTCFFVIEINAQEVTTFNGFWGPEYYQDDQKITKQELKALFATNEEVAAYWKKAETNGIIAYSAITVQLGLAFWTGYELAEDDGDALGPALGTLGFGVLATIFLNSANRNSKKAILTYNKQFDNKTSFRLVPVGNKNGLGLALKF